MIGVIEADAHQIGHERQGAAEPLSALGARQPRGVELGQPAQAVGRQDFRRDVRDLIRQIPDPTLGVEQSRFLGPFRPET